MIESHDELFDRIRSFGWTPTTDSYETKVEALDAALTHAVAGVAERLGGDVHLNLSGGVDSTLLLYRFLSLGCRVTSHTMAGGMENPDLLHAVGVCEHLDVPHEVHVVEATWADVEACEKLLGGPRHRPDNYYLLMRAVSAYTDTVVGGDCIDELLGGYYDHMKDQGAFQSRLADLIPGHLEPMEACSSAFGVRVLLPYGDAEVMRACSAFGFDELVVVGRDRKRPVYDLARRHGVLEGVLLRRKRGLVSALDEGSPT